MHSLPVEAFPQPRSLLPRSWTWSVAHQMPSQDDGGAFDCYQQGPVYGGPAMRFVISR